MKLLVSQAIYVVSLSGPQEGPASLLEMIGADTGVGPYRFRRMTPVLTLRLRPQAAYAQDARFILRSS